MATTLLSIKTDPDTKAELQEFAKTLGVSTTALVNMNIKQMLRDRRVEVSAPLVPTPHLKKLIRQSEEDYKNGDYVTLQSEKDIEDFFDSL